MAKDSDTPDKLAIRELIEQWAIFRDSLMWERFKTVWHDDGEMWSTWFQGPAKDFLKVSMKGYEAGVRVTHSLSGTLIDLKGKRAIAQTKMSIIQRGAIDGTACDVTCHGRFYDFVEKRKGKWGLVLRRCIYERDRIDTVDPSARLKLDPKILDRFPGLDGPSVEALYAKGAQWLRGKT
jgi:hypothetical protein